MCGITGFIDFKNKSFEKDLKQMVSVLAHRGPDTSGYSFANQDNYSVGLGHTRLSILDLSVNGNQPMNYKHFTISYNGEVYNFKEIRKMLIILGYEFVSDSDTEVILKSYAEWGRKCVDKFIGMFVFAIHDQEKEELVICRDRAGVKPLYYYWYDDLFMFSSELKSFHQHPHFKKELDLDSLGLFFQFGYIPHPHCIFKNSFKLKPGHWLTIELKTRKQNIEQYWNVIDFYKKPKLDISFDDAKDEVEKILKSACEYRMVSDVPVGVFLSGGYDSTAVVSLLQKGRKERIRTFTIGFENSKFDEAPYAKETAEILGTDHTEYYCNDQEAKNIIPKLPFYYDEPFGDSSAIPTVLVSQIAKKKVDVALSADAGDEVFFGYYNYVRLMKWHKYINKVPLSLKYLGFLFLKWGCQICTIFDKRFMRRADWFKELSEKSSVWESLLFRLFSQLIIPRFSDILFKNKPNKKETAFDRIVDFSFQDYIQAIDYQTYLTDDILTKVDRATMSVSLEGREPLLDHRLIEYVAQLPSEYKYDGKTTKKILKEIVHKYVPQKVMARPKSGFAVPVYDWLRSDLKYLIEEYLDPDILKGQNIFNVNFVKFQIKEFQKGEAYNMKFIWKILMFQMWYSNWFEKENQK